MPALIPREPPVRSAIRTCGPQDKADRSLLGGGELGTFPANGRTKLRRWWYNHMFGWLRHDVERVLPRPADARTVDIRRRGGPIQPLPCSELHDKHMAREAVFADSNGGRQIRVIRRELGT